MQLLEKIRKIVGYPPGPPNLGAAVLPRHAPSQAARGDRYNPQGEGL